MNLNNIIENLDRDQIITLVMGLSLVFNIILLSIMFVQKRRINDLRKALKSKLLATYNQFTEIASAANLIREYNLSQKDIGDKMYTSMSRASFILGTCNSARSDIVAYCREYLKFVPFYDDPNNPYNRKLSKRKKDKSNNNNDNSSKGISDADIKADKKANLPEPPKLNL